MNDEEFDLEVRAAAQRITEGSAPATLRSRVAAVPTEHPRSAGRVRRFGGFRGSMRLGGAAAALLVVVAVTAIAAGSLWLQNNVVPPATGGATPTTSVTPSAEPSATATPSPAPSPSPPSEPQIAGIAFFDAQHGLLVGGSDNGSGALEPGGSGIVWRTDDGGKTWAKTVLDTPALCRSPSWDHRLSGRERHALPTLHRPASPPCSQATTGERRGPRSRTKHSPSWTSWTRTTVGEPGPSA